jgi:transcriptional regulator with XRE-family HTH domain
MTFREKLIELRTGAGLSQPGLAAASGVSLATVRNYEQGRTGDRLNFASVLAISKALGVQCEVFAECEDVQLLSSQPKPEEKPKPKGKRK